MKNKKILILTQAALIAALAYVGFQFLLQTFIFLTALKMQ